MENVDNSKIRLDYLIGLIEGEGCFYKGKQIVKYRSKKTGVLRQSVSVVRTFQICMSIRDVELLRSIRDFLGFGKVYVQPKSAHYVVGRKSDLLRLIIKIDDTGGFVGYKKQQYDIWRAEVVEHLIKTNSIQ